MSLADAKEMIQRRIMEYQYIGNIYFVEEFGADNITRLEYGDAAKKYTSCAYDKFNPYISDPGPGNHYLNIMYGCGTYDEDSRNEANVIAPDIKTANQIITALLHWKMSTEQERQAFLSGKDFESIASKYRASNPKPAITEDIRRFQVMAVSAVQNKRFVEAANDYLDALKIAPWWPQGHFNVAMILGKLHEYNRAIEHMKDYLTLVPDAPNARAAQDQIYKWEADKQAAMPAQ
jgi:tetratricopeptide (TPR) repeat protein